MILIHRLLAEELTPEDEDQNGIPYLIEYYLHEKNEIKEKQRSIL